MYCGTTITDCTGDVICLKLHYVIVYPPSTRRSAPVTYTLASLAKYVTAPIRSSGLPIWPTGINAVHFRFRSGFSSKIFLVLAVLAILLACEDATRGPTSPSTCIPGLYNSL